MLNLSFKSKSIKFTKSFSNISLSQGNLMDFIAKKQNYKPSNHNDEILDYQNLLCSGLTIKMTATTSSPTEIST